MKRPHFISMLAVAACISSLLAACSNTKKASCSGDVICTQMFAAVSVKITDAAGANAVLDSVVTIREDKADRFVPQESGGEGYYVVLDDSYLNNLKMQTGKFRFKGYKNGQQVMDEPYTISADCCHISLKSGKKELALP